MSPDAKRVDSAVGGLEIPQPGAHGGDGPSVARALGIAPHDMLDLSQNLNPFAPDVAALLAHHDDAVGRYPDASFATSALAEALDVDPGRLLITNGGSEAIALVTAELGGQPLSEPDFGLHPRDGSGPRWRSDPHNPSGVLADHRTQAEVWDEAFYPLASGRWSSGRAGVIVGSLTKLFACPGLRLGYVIADDIERFARRQHRWSLGSLGLAVLPELVQRAEVNEWRDRIATARGDLARLFRDRGFVVTEADAPWVLVNAPGLREALAPQGVLVRDCSSFAMPEWMRVAVPGPVGLERLSAALDRSSQSEPVESPAAKIRAVLFDVGDTLVRAARPGTPVEDLRVEPIGGIVADLARLAREYRLGAVTDTSVMTGADVRRVLAGSGIGDFLEVVVSSVDVGAAKPDPRGLRQAMRALRVSGAETLFVGDSEVDEQAAHAAGARFVRFCDSGGSAAKLASETLANGPDATTSDAGA